TNVDEKQNVAGNQAEGCPDFSREEIGGKKRVGMGANEVGPAGLSLSHRCRIDAVFFQDVLDRLVTDPVIDCSKSASDSTITPGRILPRQANDLQYNRRIKRWPADGAGLSTIGSIKLSRDEFPMPTKNRFRHDNAGHGFQCLATQPGPDFRERDPLAIR